MTTSSDYDYAATVWKQTYDYDAVLRHLRSKGISKLDSIKALREFCDVSLADAKRIVTQSEVWLDTLAHSEKLHDAFFEGATKELPDDPES